MDSMEQTSLITYKSGYEVEWLKKVGGNFLNAFNIDRLMMEWEEGGCVLAIKKGFCVWNLKVAFPNDRVFGPKFAVGPMQGVVSGGFLDGAGCEKINSVSGGYLMGPNPFQSRSKSQKLKEGRSRCVYDFYTAKGRGKNILKGKGGKRKGKNLG
jgi:hypothetical protein